MVVTILSDVGIACNTTDHDISGKLPRSAGEEAAILGNYWRWEDGLHSLKDRKNLKKVWRWEEIN